jgi:hypothetical protein
VSLSYARSFLPAEAGRVHCDALQRQLDPELGIRVREQHRAPAEDTGRSLIRVTWEVDPGHADVRRVSGLLDRAIERCLESARDDPDQP